MTLTTLSSKELKPLYKWALRRNRAIMIIYSIFLLVFGPILDMYVATQNSGFNAIEEAGFVSQVIFQCVAAFFTFVSALKTFSYLHNKRSVDMFGSLPSNRTTMFVSHLLAGLTAIMVPYLGVSVITLGLTARSGDALKFGLFSIGATLLMILAAYVFTSLIAYCCGTIIDTAIVTIAVNAIWVGIIAIYYGLITDMIPGMPFSTIVDTPLIILFAPYGFSLVNSAYYVAGQTGSYVTLFIWNILYIVGVLFLALYAANKRKAETSQNGFAVKWLPMAIKAGASVVCGAFIGFIAAEVSYSGYSNMFVFSFWYVIFALVAFVILHIIFARGVKGRIIPSLITYVCTSVVALGLVFGISFGMGIDTYVPQAGTIKSVQFSYKEFSDPENIKTITQIHKIITEGVRNENEYPYYLGCSPRHEYYVYDYDETVTTAEYDDYDYARVVEAATAKYPYVNSTRFDFTYKRKLGFGVSRDYYLYVNSIYDKDYDYAALEELLEKLYSSEEYKRMEKAYLFDDEMNEKITDGYLWYFTYAMNQYTESGTADLPSDKEFMDGLTEALRTDILADQNFVNSYSANYISSNFNKYIGDTGIILRLSYSNDQNKESRSTYYSQSTYEYFLIKSDYVNTVKYLNDHNIIPGYSGVYSDYADYTYNDNYYNFCSDGEKYDLDKLVGSECIDWVMLACNTYQIDVNEWFDNHFKAYRTDITEKTDELYDMYMSEDITFFYDDSYVDYGPYTEIANMIVNDLLKYTFEYVEKTQDTPLAESDTDITSDTDSEKSTDSAESKTSQASKTESVAEESKKPDTDASSAPAVSETEV